MRITILNNALLLLIATVAANAQQPSTSATAPANPLIGRWEINTGGGRPLPAGIRLFWVFDADTISVFDDKGERFSQNPYKLDTSKTPMTFTMKIKCELDRIAWVEIKDNELRMIMTVNTGKAPTSWEIGRVSVFRLAPPKTEQ